MSDRMDFEIVCPNDHEQTVSFSREEFETELKSGALTFHCNTCDTNWPPSHEDIAKIRKQLSKIRPIGPPHPNRHGWPRSGASTTCSSSGCGARSSLN